VDNRRLLIAALLSMAVLFFWQVAFPPPEPPQRSRPAAPAAESADAASAAAPLESAPPSSAPAGTEPAAAPALDEAAPVQAPVALAAAEERTAVLENDLVRAEFSNRGAALVSLLLKFKEEVEGGPIEMVQRRSSSPYPFALTGADGAAHPLDEALWVAEPSAGDGLRFRYRGPEGAAEKSFRLLPDGRLEYAIEVSGSASPWRVLIGPGLRVLRAEELDNRFNRRAAVWRSGGEVSTASPKKGEPTRVPGAGLDWIGIEDTYFLTAVVPDAGLAEARLESVLLVPAGDTGVVFDARPVAAGAELSDAEKKLPRAWRLELVPGADGRTSGSSYWGAKQYDRLASFGIGLEKTVSWGVFGMVARPLLGALQWIHAHLTPNYGWAIVLLTTALKILLLPLSLAAFKSMRKMQKLNPKMQAVRERYRPKLRDKQGRFNPEVQKQMNEEIMALYRQEGVNPAGGCLPMLVQLPIFFGFYQVLSTAVELWRAPWVGWVHDLTAPDPYWILPIVMGLSQIAQQRMTPPPPDPVQKKLMQALPIVFTVFSLGFASGLVLYWFTNNLLTIGQQALYNSMRERAEHAEEEEKKAAKRSKKKG